MGWIFRNARDAFDEHRERWDEINKKSSNHVVLDSTFVSALVRHFASDQTLLGISNDRNRLGMLIVDKVRPGFWQTFQPSQGPMGLMLLENEDVVEQQISELIRQLPGYSLGLAVTQQDPDFTAFKNLRNCRKIEIVDYITTPRITLSGTFEDYWRNRGRDLTRNVARRLRRATEEKIDFELVAVRDAGNVARCVQEYGMLEATGWKGKEGTAVTAENAQGLFYRDILEKFCERGEGVIYRLLMNGRVIASDLCVERNGMLVVLKVAYDETVKNVSPSFLLRRMVLENLFSTGNFWVVEFYGRVRDWHLKWTEEVRTMYHVNFYRDSWVPTVRHFIKSGTRFVTKTGANEGSHPSGRS
jgi:Acetyltransferase (GNAT) domain